MNLVISSMASGANPLDHVSRQHDDRSDVVLAVAVVTCVVTVVVALFN